MNEDYLKQFRKQPNTNFVKKIHVRLDRKERIQMIKRYVMRSALVLAFMFGMLMTFSSTVRAEVIGFIVKIGDLQYDVTSSCPGCSDEDVNIITPENLSLEEARSRFSFPIQLPAYVPQEYKPLAVMEFYKWGNGASPWLGIIWKKWEGNKQIGRIDLVITPCLSSSTSCGMIVGEGALEEIMLNGKPAVVIRGAWNYDTKEYDLAAGMSIQWRYDENTVYRLSSYSLSLEELIKMAESIP